MNFGSILMIMMEKLTPANSTCWGRVAYDVCGCLTLTTGGLFLNNIKKCFLFRYLSIISKIVTFLILVCCSLRFFVFCSFYNVVSLQTDSWLCCKKFYSCMASQKMLVFVQQLMRLWFWNTIKKYSHDIPTFCKF